MKARGEEKSEKLNFYYDHIRNAQGLSHVSAEVYVLLVTKQLLVKS
jgi:hypothetical protein